MAKTLERRVEELEKKVAELEKSAQPRKINADELASAMSKAICEAIRDTSRGVQK